MSKKLITACMALVALAAFALPAVASAANDPDLTHPTGTLLNPSGKTCTTASNAICIKATNIGHTLLLDGSNNQLTTCTTATMTGWLTKNDGSNVEGTIHTAEFGGTGGQVAGDAEPECTGTFGSVSIDTNVGANGVPWCIRSTATMADDEFQVRGNACNEEASAITFVMTSTTVGTCKYSRSGAIKGTYTTHSTGEAIMSLTSGTNTEFTKEEGGIFCPSVGRLQMSFTLETDTASAEPLYIS